MIITLTVMDKSNCESFSTHILDNLWFLVFQRCYNNLWGFNCVHLCLRKWSQYELLNIKWFGQHFKWTSKCSTDHHLTILTVIDEIYNISRNKEIKIKYHLNHITLSVQCISIYSHTKLVEPARKLERKHLTFS